MKPEDALAMIGQPEGQKLEYKVSLPPPEVVAHHIAGFANADGGWLVIGISDRHGGIQISGIDPDVPAAAIVEDAVARLRPNPVITHHYVNSGGKLLYVIAVPKRRGPLVLLGDAAYQRRGDALINMGALPSRPSIGSRFPLKLRSCHEKLRTESESATTAKKAFLMQSDSLLSLASILIDDLCFDGADKPSRFLHGRAFIRLAYSSLIDSWERYLSDVLVEVHLADPRTLRSQSQFKAEDILSCSSIPELIQMMASEKVGVLSRGGLDDFLKYLKSIVGTDLLSKDNLRDIDRLYAVRNLFTHSNGMVDRRFIRQMEQPSLAIGSEYMVTLDDFCSATELIVTTVAIVDSELMVKYNLSSAT